MVTVYRLKRDYPNKLSTIVITRLNTVYVKKEDKREIESFFTKGEVTVLGRSLTNHYRYKNFKGKILIEKVFFRDKKSEFTVYYSRDKETLLRLKKYLELKYEV